MFEDPRRLVEACVRGDARAQATFEEMFRSTVSRTVRTLFPNEQCGIGPDDAVQESLFRVFEVLDRWNGGNLHAFVATITRFKTIEILRSIRKETEALRHSTQVRPENTRSDENESAEQIALRNERAEEARNALNSLDQRYRTVVELRLFEALTFDEIGARLEIASSTARVRFASALPKLAQQLQRIERDYS